MGNRVRGYAYLLSEHKEIASEIIKGFGSTEETAEIFSVGKYFGVRFWNDTKNELPINYLHRLSETYGCIAFADASVECDLPDQFCISYRNITQIIQYEPDWGYRLDWVTKEMQPKISEEYSELIPFRVDNYENIIDNFVNEIYIRTSDSAFILTNEIFIGDETFISEENSSKQAHELYINLCEKYKVEQNNDIDDCEILRKVLGKEFSVINRIAIPNTDIYSCYYKMPDFFETEEEEYNIPDDYESLAYEILIDILHTMSGLDKYRTLMGERMKIERSYDKKIEYGRMSYSAGTNILWLEILFNNIVKSYNLEDTFETFYVKTKWA